MKIPPRPPNRPNQKLWLFAHSLPLYSHCWTSNNNQPSIAIYYGGSGDGGFLSGVGSSGGGCGFGVGGRVMVVA